MQEQKGLDAEGQLNTIMQHLLDSGVDVSVTYTALIERYTNYSN